MVTLRHYFKAWSFFKITCVCHFLEQFEYESVARRSLLLRAPGDEVKLVYDLAGR